MEVYGNCNTIVLYKAKFICKKKMISLGKYGGFKKGVFKYITRYSQNTIKKEVEMLTTAKNIYATLV